MVTLVADLTGKVFGQWKVLARAPSRPYLHKASGVTYYQHYWLCKCSCNREIEVAGVSLLRKRSTQCKNCRAARYIRSDSRPVGAAPRRRRSVDYASMQEVGRGDLSQRVRMLEALVQDLRSKLAEKADVSPPRS